MTFLQINTHTKRITTALDSGKGEFNSLEGRFLIPVTSIRACTLDEGHRFMSVKTLHETLNLHSTGWPMETLMEGFCELTEALLDHYADRSDVRRNVTVTEAAGCTTLVNLYYNE